MLPCLSRCLDFIFRICLAISIVVFALSTDCISASGESADISEPRLNDEQLRNYKDHDTRIQKIIDIVFADMTYQQKLSWRILLLGTVATETNFLDRYSGRSKNGNGPYQIIGATAYGIIHRYITYPLSNTNAIARREELIPIFEKVTQGRMTWDMLYAMSRDQLVGLCVADYDFAALMSLLVYKEAFRRNNIDEILPEPENLAKLWKQYYNTSLGSGTEKRFIERLMFVYSYIV
jgi:hypothetical protein